MILNYYYRLFHVNTGTPVKSTVYLTFLKNLTIPYLTYPEEETHNVFYTKAMNENIVKESTNS